MLSHHVVLSNKYFRCSLSVKQRLCGVVKLRFGDKLKMIVEIVTNQWMV